MYLHGIKAWVWESVNIYRVVGILHPSWAVCPLLQNTSWKFRKDARHRGHTKDTRLDASKWPTSLTSFPLWVEVWHLRRVPSGICRVCPHFLLSLDGLLAIPTILGLATASPQSLPSLSHGSLSMSSFISFPVRTDWMGWGYLISMWLHLTIRASAILFPNTAMCWGPGHETWMHLLRGTSWSHERRYPRHHGSPIQKWDSWAYVLHELQAGKSTIFWMMNHLLFPR